MQRGQLGNMPVTRLFRQGRFLPYGQMTPLPGMPQFPQFDIENGFTGLDTDATERTFTFNVIVPPVAPTGQNNSEQTAEDISKPLTATDFGFSDTDPNTFVGLWITAIPNAATQGTLVDNGHTIVAGDLVSQSSNTSISPNSFSDASRSGIER